MSNGHVLFDHVWKRFHRGPAHDSLRDLIPALWRQAGRRATGEARLAAGDFWAVRDVSFEVKPGQALGIIGGNGAGKSTTLKLLTKVLTATSGLAEIRGRAGALIEVSAGFHADLTGRENVFLQGAIMGMSQRRIRERFDEIVDFSGISAFIDTPVKRYSSGMNARLGFSIAVHLEPEVLIIDEVLSVGDAEFQGRAFDRIRSVVKSDIPVVMVSHQLERVIELCTDCILLQAGSVAFHGDVRSAVDVYLRGTTPTAAAPRRHSHVTIISLEPGWTRPLVAGTSSSFTITGEVSALDVPGEITVEVCLRDTQGGERIFGIDLRQVDPSLNAVGPFARTFAFDVTMPPGLYRLESLVYHRGQGLVMQDGPAALLPVMTQSGTFGNVQLNVRPVQR